MQSFYIGCHHSDCDSRFPHFLHPKCTLFYFPLKVKETLDKSIEDEEEEEEQRWERERKEKREKRQKELQEAKEREQQELERLEKEMVIVNPTR